MGAHTSRLKFWFTPRSEKVDPVRYQVPAFCYVKPTRDHLQKVQFDLPDRSRGVPELPRANLGPKKPQNWIFWIYFFRAGGTVWPWSRVCRPQLEPIRAVWSFLCLRPHPARPSTLFILPVTRTTPLQELQERSRTIRSITRMITSSSRTTFMWVLKGFKRV